MRIPFKLLFAFLLLGLNAHIHAQEIKKGLRFHSFEVNKENRTCLDLTPARPLALANGFTLSFDVMIRNEAHYFGYIFRIIANDTVNIDLLTDVSSETKFSLVVKNKVLLQFNKLGLGDLPINKWMKVALCFNPAKSELTLSTNEITRTVPCQLMGLKKFNFYFGGNNHELFSTTDVPPMTVKDIRIYNEHWGLTRNWKLERHAGDWVYDECISDKAVASNPLWEINNHIHWKRRTVVNIPFSNIQIAYDRSGNRIFIVKGTSLLVYQCNTNKLDTIAVKGGLPYNCLNNQIIFDNNRNVLLSYNFDSNELNSFNPHNGRWTNTSDSVPRPRSAHHGRLFLTADSSIITFGGYGFHHYNSLLCKYSISKNKWCQKDLSSDITPRYLGSMGYYKQDTILYFGGFGSASGKQEEFPQNYYDLYKIGINKQTAKKVWSFQYEGEQFTNSNSLVFDSLSNVFYALAYPNKRYKSIIALHEYQLNRPEFRIVGDTVPYLFNDVDSYCDLFLDANHSELYAITVNSKADNNSEITLCSIAYPPLNEAEVLQNNQGTKLYLAITLVILLLIGLLAYIFLIKKMHRWQKPSKTPKQTISNNPLDSHALAHFENAEEKEVEEKVVIEEESSTILRHVKLLGSFEITDRGNNLSDKMTQTTIQIFAFLLLSTIHNGKGISSEGLKTAIWPNKDDNSARNNRNVYINKLRALFKSFGGAIEINTENGYWCIRFDSSIFCDYKQVLLILERIESEFNKARLSQLLKLASGGTLLSHLPPSDWLDNFQSEYSNSLITSLLKTSRHLIAPDDLPLLLRLADVILLHDNIEEEAIRMKCYALFHLGRKNQALQCFSKFTTDYEHLLGEKHQIAFEQMIRSPF